jgi:putative flippase GtrA
MVQKLWKLRHHSAARYILVGLSAFTTQYVVLNLSYYVLSIHLHVATSLGYIAGLFVSYFFNRHWVFGEAGKHKHIAHQSVEYIVLMIFNYFFTLIGVSFLKSHNIEPYISPVLITAAITCWNYALYKKVIFKGEKVEPNPY